jgi:hypothetical protein
MRKFVAPGSNHCGRHHSNPRLVTPPPPPRITGLNTWGTMQNLTDCSMSEAIDRVTISWGTGLTYGMPGRTYIPEESDLPMYGSYDVGE